MKTTRRNFLGAVASTSLPVSVGACVAVIATQAEAAPTVLENPDLIAAHARLLDASNELRAAEDALQWIADEWRHLWPLAPEELLMGANADRGARDDGAERDIIGRYLKRDTSSLCERFSKRMRQQTPTACFSVLSSDEARETLKALRLREPKGKTELTRAKARVDLDNYIKKFQNKLELTEKYEAETRTLRKKAGVDQAKLRVALAKDALDLVCSEISKLPAIGMEGLLIKAGAINVNGYVEGFKRGEGIIGEMARFVEQFISMHGGVEI